MENNNKYTIDKLNQIISIAEDGKEGYEKAAENVKNASIKNSFLHISDERSAYASQVRQIVLQINGEAEDKGGGAVGTLHRLWIDLKSVLTSGDTDAILNACITGEEAAIKEYKSVLEDDEIPESYKPLIREQLHGIEQALANIRLHVNQ
jgi:uncharacterized protein (TIGR02284 family)